MTKTEKATNFVNNFLEAEAKGEVFNFIHPDGRDKQKHYILDWEGYRDCIDEIVSQLQERGYDAKAQVYHHKLFVRKDERDLEKKAGLNAQIASAEKQRDELRGGKAEIDRAGAFEAPSL